MSAWLNVAVVIALILIEGLFVAAELALVSLREGQARALAEPAGAGRRSRSWSPTRTASWPPSSSASPSPRCCPARSAPSRSPSRRATRWRGRARQDPRRRPRLSRGHPRHHLRDPGGRRAGAQAPRAAAHRAAQPAFCPGARRHRPRLASGDLAALEPARTGWSSCSAVILSAARSPSPRRSCAGWWRRTRRSGSRSAGSSMTSSRPAPAWYARSWSRAPR